jgi:hypothetical protein
LIRLTLLLGTKFAKTGSFTDDVDPRPVSNLEIEMRALFSSLMLALLAAPALAADPGQLPEPGSLALVGIAAAAGLFVAMRKKK